MVDCLLLCLLQLLHYNSHVTVLCDVKTVTTCDVLQVGISSEAKECVDACPVSLLCSHVQRSCQVEVCAVHIGSSFLQHNQRSVDVVCGAQPRIRVDHHPVHRRETTLQVGCVHVRSPDYERFHHLVSCMSCCVVEHRHLVFVCRVHVDSSVD